VSAAAFVVNRNGVFERLGACGQRAGPLDQDVAFGAPDAIVGWRDVLRDDVAFVPVFPLRVGRAEPDRVTVAIEERETLEVRAQVQHGFQARTGALMFGGAVLIGWSL